MSTAAVTECAGGCGLSMRQSSMLRLMIKPFMSILGKTEDIRYIILTHSAYCDFQSPGLEKGLHSKIRVFPILCASRNKLEAKIQKMMPLTTT